ncbi:unnamed protein product, partial [Prorocentrum cordatum]
VPVPGGVVDLPSRGRIKSFDANRAEHCEPTALAYDLSNGPDWQTRDMNILMRIAGAGSDEEHWQCISQSMNQSQSNVNVIVDNKLQQHMLCTLVLKQTIPARSTDILNCDLTNAWVHRHLDKCGHECFAEVILQSVQTLNIMLLGIWMDRSH